MQHLIRIFSILLLLGYHGLLVAAPAATVEALQAESWLHRSGENQALQIGMALQSGDQIRTGANARVRLRMLDDSVVKLGEHAIIDLEDLSPAKQEDGLFKATLHLLKGAFRYTAEKPAKREVSIKVAGIITAGIRGTDIWGKSGQDKDILCLIEGKIEVTSGDTHVVMQEASSFFIVPKNKPPLPVALISAEKLASWSLQTEMTNEK